MTMQTNAYREKWPPIIKQAQSKSESESTSSMLDKSGRAKKSTYNLTYRQLLLPHRQQIGNQSYFPFISPTFLHNAWLADRSFYPIYTRQLIHFLCRIREVFTPTWSANERSLLTQSARSVSLSAQSVLRRRK